MQPPSINHKKKRFRISFTLNAHNWQPEKDFRLPSWCLHKIIDIQVYFRLTANIAVSFVMPINSRSLLLCLKIKVNIEYSDTVNMHITLIFAIAHIICIY